MLASSIRGVVGQNSDRPSGFHFSFWKSAEESVPGSEESVPGSEEKPRERSRGSG